MKTNPKKLEFKYNNNNNIWRGYAKTIWIVMGYINIYIMIVSWCMYIKDLDLVWGDSSKYCFQTPQTLCTSLGINLINEDSISKCWSSASIISKYTCVAIAMMGDNNIVISKYRIEEKKMKIYYYHRYNTKRWIINCIGWNMHSCD